MLTFYNLVFNNKPRDITFFYNNDNLFYRRDVTFDKCRAFLGSI